MFDSKAPSPSTLRQVPSRNSLFGVVVCMTIASLSLGCATPSWLKALGEEKPKVVEAIQLPEFTLELGSLDTSLAGSDFEAGDRASLTRLSQLAEIFYERLAHRRVNSISTYHDPALREFFRSEEAFADYYADLVQALDIAHFEANRPREIALESLHVEQAADRAVAVVRFVGNNALPLRFWSVDYARRDVWQRSGDRWWIIPGKL